MASFAIVENLSQRLIIILANTCKLEFSKIFLSTHEIQHQNPLLIPLIFSFVIAVEVLEVDFLLDKDSNRLTENEEEIFITDPKEVLTNASDFFKKQYRFRNTKLNDLPYTNTAMCTLEIIQFSQRF